jgi:protein TonB
MRDRPEQVPVHQVHNASVKKESPPTPVPTLPPVITAPSEKASVTADALQSTDTPIRPESRTSAMPLFSASAAPGKSSSASGTQLPSSSAEYLNNPAPAYPALSLRLNEAGKVVIRVLIGKDGLALEGSIVQSSGYDRLDQAALRAVLKWRYVPGKVDGQARDMWFDVPIKFKPRN